MMPQKLVIYFDQNFVSNLAKAEAGFHTSGNYQREYKKLYEDLLKLVQADKIICPASEFYYLEGVQKSPLVAPLQDVATRLGFGVWFRDFVEVIIGQARIALHAYVSGAAPNYSSKLVAFAVDPTLPVLQLGRHLASQDLEGKREAALNASNRAAARMVQLKDEFASHLNSAHELASKVNRSDSDQLHAEKQSFIRAFFREPFGKVLSQLTGAPRSQGQDVRIVLPMERHASGVVKLYFEFKRLVALPSDSPFAHLEAFDRFLDSELVRNIPFIQVYTSIVADARLGGRPIKQSDLIDWGIAALVIPYVDKFVTDSALADSIRRGKVTSRYKVTVLTDTSEGRQKLRELLASLR